MSWRDNLHLDGKGSFRGVEFLVNSAESSIGRRTVVHEFPGRNTPSVEDIGRLPRRFRLTCYVVGPEYDVERDLLRDEFETEGSGQLVHPYWGEFKVSVVGAVQIRETPAEGGMARFDLDVVEVDDKKLTIALLDLEPLVSTKADTAAENVEDDFAAVSDKSAEDVAAAGGGFSLVGAIESVRLAAVAIVQDAVQAIKDVRAPANALINLIDDVESALDDLEDAASTLLNTPALLASTLQSAVREIFAGLSDLSQDVADLIAAGQKDVEAVDGSNLFDDFRATRALEVFEGLTTNGDDVAAVRDTGSVQSDIEAANQAALIRMFQVVGAIEGARAFATFDFDSRDKALEVRDTVAETLSTLAEGASDSVYGALVDLRATLSAHLSEVAATLPEILELTPLETQPSLVMVYDLYGDLSFESSFLVRNRVENPLTVPGLIPVEVLANE